MVLNIFCYLSCKRFLFFFCKSIWNYILSEAKVKSGFPGGTVGKNMPASAGDTGDTGLITGSSHWVQKIPWRRKWKPTPVFLPGKSHGQRRLAGYSPGGCQQSDTTELACTSQGSNVVFVLVHTQLSQHDIKKAILSLMLWTLFWSSYSISFNYLSISIVTIQFQPHNINFYSLK